MIKKLLVACCIGALVGGMWLGSVSAFTVDEGVTDRPFDAGQEQGDDGSAATDIGQVLKDDVVEGEEEVVRSLLDNFDNNNIDDSGGQTATFYIKNLLNWFLAAASFVALIILVFGFYKMFTANDQQEAYKDAVKIVKGAAIAIFIIGVSRFLASYLFDIFFRVRDAV